MHVRAVKCTNIKSSINIGGVLSKPFAITKGLNSTFNIWRRKCKSMGITIDAKKKLFTLHFVYDQVILAEDGNKVSYVRRKLGLK